MPKITFADVLKIFYQLFFVIPIADAQKKHVEFIQFDEMNYLKEKIE